MRFACCICAFFMLTQVLFPGELFVASFKRSVQPERSVKNSALEWGGEPRIIPGKGLRQGEGALFMDERCHGKIPIENLNQREGTISFWWKPAVKPKQKTWSLLYGDWDDGKSYFVLSHGWWDCYNKIFLIYHNYSLLGGQSFMEEQVQDIWNFYAVSWKRTGDKVKVTFFLNGISSQRVGKLDRHVMLRSPLLLGRDASHSHPATGYYRNLIIHDSMLSPEALRSLMIRDTSQEFADRISQIQHYGWMGDVSGKAPRETRNATGTLLESRVAFVENGPHLASPEQVGRELDRIRSSGYNVAMVQVGYAVPNYQSSQYPESAQVADYKKKFPGRNAYASFIAEAHGRGLEVHSSFALGYTFAHHVPASWKRYVTPDGQGMNYYDPAFRKMVVNLVVDHVVQYDVDGVNLDYVRTIGNGLDSDVAAGDYARLYKRSLSEDRGNAERMKRFSARCVGEVVYNIQKQLRAFHRDLVISVASITKTQADGLDDGGRNSSHWMEAGWIDCSYSMEYGAVLGTQTMDQCRRESVFPQGYVIGIGNFRHVCSPGGKLSTVSAPRKQWIARLDYIRRKYNDGNGLFTYFWNIIDDDDIAALRQGPFRERALPYWCRQQERHSLDEVFPLPEK